MIIKFVLSWALWVSWVVIVAPTCTSASPRPPSPSQSTVHESATPSDDVPSPQRSPPLVAEAHEENNSSGRITVVKNKEQFYYVEDTMFVKNNGSGSMEESWTNEESTPVIIEINGFQKNDTDVLELFLLNDGNVSVAVVNNFYSINGEIMNKENSILQDSDDCNGVPLLTISNTDVKVTNISYFHHNGSRSYELLLTTNKTDAPVISINYSHYDNGSWTLSQTNNETIPAITVVCHLKHDNGTGKLFLLTNETSQTVTIINYSHIDNNSSEFFVLSNEPASIITVVSYLQTKNNDTQMSNNNIESGVVKGNCSSSDKENSAQEEMHGGKNLTTLEVETERRRQCEPFNLKILKALMSTALKKENISKHNYAKSRYGCSSWYENCPVIEAIDSQMFDVHTMISSQLLAISHQTELNKVLQTSYILLQLIKWSLDRIKIDEFLFNEKNERLELNFELYWLDSLRCEMIERKLLSPFNNLWQELVRYGDYVPLRNKRRSFGVVVIKDFYRVIRQILLSFDQFK